MSYAQQRAGALVLLVCLCATPAPTEAMTENRLVASDTVNGDNFGDSVAISGDGSRVVVGASWHDDGGDGTGSAYVFNGSDGTQLLKLVASDAANGDTFGNSVAISGDGSRVVVGASYDDGISGSAYLFIEVEPTAEPTSEPTPLATPAPTEATPTDCPDACDDCDGFMSQWGYCGTSFWHRYEGTDCTGCSEECPIVACTGRNGNTCVEWMSQWGWCGDTYWYQVNGTDCRSCVDQSCSELCDTEGGSCCGWVSQWGYCGDTYWHQVDGIDCRTCSGCSGRSL